MHLAMAEIIVELDVLLTYSVSQLVFQSPFFFFFSNKTHQRDRGEPGTSLGRSTLDDDDFLSIGVCGLLVHTDPRDSGL